MTSSVSIDAGSGDGLAYLSECYRKGIGIPQNDERADELLAKAYHTGLSNYYFTGNGTKTLGAFGGKLRKQGVSVKDIAWVMETLQASMSNQQEMKANISSIRGDTEDIRKTTDEINVKADTLIDVTKDVRQTLSRIEASLKDYESIITSWKNDQDLIDIRNTKGETSDEYIKKLNEILAKIDKVSTLNAREAADAPESNISYDDEKSKLKEKFGEENWIKLTNESQESLTSARVLLKLTNQLGDATESFDFSGVIISTAVSLERELRLRFGASNPGFDDTKDFTLGSLHYALHCHWNGWRYIKDYASKDMLKYLRSILKPEYASGDPRDCFINETIRDDTNKPCSFMETVYHINKTYRIPAAHTSKMSKDQAINCCARVIGPIDADTRLTATESALAYLMTILK